MFVGCTCVTGNAPSVSTACCVTRVLKIHSVRLHCSRSNRPYCNLREAILTLLSGLVAHLKDWMISQLFEYLNLHNNRKMCIVSKAIG